ncbi:hypothetical protein Adt_05550 [Abeliophyllum distichum]|uniref:Uncharacterized protein n=1 Tax=Abeliophyllum distichum TaxID=126358 RepID=A0ABD1V4E4_9LAMI
MLRQVRATPAPRMNNANANVLSKLERSRDSELLKLFPIKHLTKPSIEAVTEVRGQRGGELYSQEGQRRDIRQRHKRFGLGSKDPKAGLFLAIFKEGFPAPHTKV